MEQMIAAGPILSLYRSDDTFILKEGNTIIEKGEGVKFAEYIDRRYGDFLENVRGNDD